MYIPKIFKKENSKQVFDFIKENSFATLISTENEKSLADFVGRISFKRKTIHIHCNAEVCDI